MIAPKEAAIVGLAELALGPLIRFVEVRLGDKGVGVLEPECREGAWKGAVAEGFERGGDDGRDRFEDVKLTALQEDNTAVRVGGMRGGTNGATLISPGGLKNNVAGLEGIIGDRGFLEELGGGGKGC